MALEETLDMEKDELVKTGSYLSSPRLRHKVCSTRPWLQVYLRPRCENWVVSTSESRGSGGNGVDGRVTEVTERSGRGTEVTEGVQRLWKGYGGYGGIRRYVRRVWRCAGVTET